MRDARRSRVHFFAYSHLRTPEHCVVNKMATTTTTRRYPFRPTTQMEWSPERRDPRAHYHVHAAQWSQFGTDSGSDVGPVPSVPPELPNPQREGLELIDRGRGYGYTLGKTRTVPAAWSGSTSDVGYPAGCGVDGISRVRGCWRYVKEELSEGEE